MQYLKAAKKEVNNRIAADAIVSEIIATDDLDILKTKIRESIQEYNVEIEDVSIHIGDGPTGNDVARNIIIFLSPRKRNTKKGK